MIEAFVNLRELHRGFEGAQIHLETDIGRPSCTRGCGKCCQVSTPKCMTIEAMHAISILTGQLKLKTVLSIAEGWLLERHNEAPSYNGMLTGCFVPSNIRGELESLSILPCPFLMENKECLIHDARPLECRAYGVTRAASGFCPRPPGKGETLTQFQYIYSPTLREGVQSFKKKYKAEHPLWTTFSFLPTLIYRAAREQEYRRLVLDNKIATAKIIGTQIDTTLMWQAQAEKLQAGVAPDLVAEID